MDLPPPLTSTGREAFSPKIDSFLKFKLEDMCGQSQHQPSVHEQGFVVLQPKARCDPASFFLGWPLFFDAPHRQSRLHSTHSSLALLVGRPHTRHTRPSMEMVNLSCDIPYRTPSNHTGPYREKLRQCAPQWRRTVGASRRHGRSKVGWLAAPAVHRQSLPWAPLTGRAPLEGFLPPA